VPDAVIAALAMTGATTVVAAMATDAWQAARSGTVRLFDRSDASQQADIKAQLDSTADLVRRAPDAGRARQGLVPVWQLRLEELLGQYPEAAAELEDLVRQVRTTLPAAQQHWVQTNVARDNGQVFAALGGNVVVHQAAPGPPQPPAPPADAGHDRGGAQ
jgi:LmbE family N-acetylglucosaminyl deacetylase